MIDECSAASRGKIQGKTQIYVIHGGVIDSKAYEDARMMNVRGGIFLHLRTQFV